MTEPPQRYVIRDDKLHDRRDQPEGGVMFRYVVHADIGSGELEVEAATAEEALNKAIAEWMANFDKIINDATFEVRRSYD